MSLLPFVKSTQKKLRIGVIGLGKMGELHVKKLLSLQQKTSSTLPFDLSGVFDKEEKKIQEVATGYSVNPFSSLDELFFESDAVVLACSTAQHYSIAKKIIENKIHLLIEKPMTLFAKEAKQLAILADAANIVLQVGFLERFRFQFLAKELSFSEISSIECVRNSVQVGREKNLDVISDLMIHDLDLILSLLKEEPTSIVGVGKAVATPLLDSAYVVLQFPSKIEVSLTASRVAERQERTFCISSGDRTHQFNFNTNTRLDLIPLPSGREKKKEGEFDALEVQAESFIRSILEKKPPMISGWDGYKAVHLANRIQQEIESNIEKNSYFTLLEQASTDSIES